MGYPFGKPMFDFFAADGDPDRLLSALERFIEFWFGPRDVDYGVSEMKLRQFELPTPLKRLYAFAGQWPAENFWGHLFTWQDRIEPFEMLRIEDGKLVFLWENQGVWRCGTALAGSDPAVWVKAGEEPWFKVCDSLARFLVTFVLTESVLGSKHTGYMDSALRLLKDRGCQIVPVWLDGPYATYEGCSPRSIHLVDGQLLVLNEVRVAAQDDVAAEKYADLFKEPQVLRTKEPFWDDPDVMSGWIKVSQLETLAYRHTWHARQLEALLQKHREWEKFFRAAAEAARKADAKDGGAPRVP
jgi:hypothetical protein